ncbi:PDR/VanB family oxidoreductase [Actinomycetospora termitidis]|uniref:PDR/VanB family oxidoreductase n=1 Tax=Actinomycetospora termitidis TaxID=3053470 RepID=A0ABT7M632_9PSEU|nr:PDR/VanB family oxidoreductase [Actinomycetospora sp. Odt1-22]MDL5156135.1 PDR/VanB family oxidoreductase [Actinomycetospora sp. Odt1-22]
MIATVVRSRTDLADGICLLELAAADGAALPGFGAGDHIDLELGPNLVRSYSLCDTPTGAPSAYRVAIALDPASRGGSRRVHELAERDRVDIRAPVGHFPLVEEAAHTVLVAGGIGVTPIVSMARRLTELGASWGLHYAVRTRSVAAFVPELEHLAETAGAHFALHVDDEMPDDDRVLPLRPLVDGAPSGAHFYCCGPGPMLDAFLAATADVAPERVHVERFRAEPVEPDAEDGGFEVELARSGSTFEIGPEDTVLDVLLDNDVDVDFSCMEGICGSCRVQVLDGAPDHRDTTLNATEREAGVMLVCCSRAKGRRLVLDL